VAAPAADIPAAAIQEAATQAAATLVVATRVAATPGGGCPGGGNDGGNYPTGQGHIDGRKNLERMVQETGGRFFEIKKNQNVAQIYNEIASELRAQYRLGYTPTQDAAANGYHQIELTLHQKGLVIQTREGYYTGK